MNVQFQNKPNPASLTLITSTANIVKLCWFGLHSVSDES